MNRSPSLLFWLILAIAVAFATYALIATLPNAPENLKNAVGVQTPGQQRVSLFETAYKDRLLNYTDPVYGFSLRYPIGYYVQSDPEPGVRLRLSADVPFSSSEVIDFAASNDTFTDTDFDAIVRAYAPQAITFTRRDSINGRIAFQLGANMTSEYTNENLLVRQLFLQCSGENAEPGVGSYWLAITALVPSSVAADLIFVDYLAYRVSC